jgi:hypothetical protein
VNEEMSVLRSDSRLGTCVAIVQCFRGGHYGQRPRVPHEQAEHMAAPTNAANVKKVLAKSEPSTHGTKRTCQFIRAMSAIGGKADITLAANSHSSGGPRLVRRAIRSQMTSNSQNPTMES